MECAKCDEDVVICGGFSDLHLDLHGWFGNCQIMYNTFCTGSGSVIIREFHPVPIGVSPMATNADHP